MENTADHKVEDGVEDGDRISNLPKEILYRILYFLPKREAARTCVLSKSWRFLWKNRLTVSFNERSSLFDGPQRTRLFVSRVNNVLQTQLDHNHLVEEFHLGVTNSPGSISLLENWIPMLTAIGVRELFLSITSETRSSPYVVLPSAVFKSECLTSLHLCRCRLSLHKITKIHFVRLKVLGLLNVIFTGEHIFKKIISSCPLIEIMRLQECQGLKNIKLLPDNNRYLKHFIFVNEHAHEKRECSIEIHAVPTLELMHILGSKVRFHGHKFGNLKELGLYCNILSSNSFDCSWRYEFPSLARLTFACCSGWEQFDQPLRINAPKILLFRYAGPAIASIIFTTPMLRQCKSEITLRFRHDPQSWFLKLSRLLQAVSRSEIFLSVYQNPEINIAMNIEQESIDSINKPPVVVEELRLNMGHLSSFPSFLNGMFRICRPRKLDQYRYVLGGRYEEERDDKELIEFLCNFLMKRSESGGIPEIFTMQEDLEDVKIESFDTSRQQWQPTMMLECGALPQSNRIRFQMKWRDAACESSSMRRKLE